MAKVSPFKLERINVAIKDKEADEIYFVNIPAWCYEDSYGIQLAAHREVRVSKNNKPYYGNSWMVTDVGSGCALTKSADTRELAVRRGGAKLKDFNDEDPSNVASVLLKARARSAGIKIRYTLPSVKDYEKDERV